MDIVNLEPYSNIFRVRLVPAFVEIGKMGRFHCCVYRLILHWVILVELL